MFTTANALASRQADLGMPVSRCDDALWLRALPEFTGEVSVRSGDVQGDVRPDALDLATFPGTTAWSPPT